MKLKDLSKMYSNNDGTRSLFESVVANDLVSALEDWKKNAQNAVLIGGLALSYHVKPRYTMDIDALYASEADIPVELLGFKRIRPHAFQHHGTHAEVEVLSPEFLNNDITKDTAKQIFKTAIMVDGIKVASKSGLVAAKLGRANYQDKADIIQLIQSGGVDISNFKLTKAKVKLYNQLEAESKIL